MRNTFYEFLRLLLQSPAVKLCLTVCINKKPGRFSPSGGYVLLLTALEFLLSSRLYCRYRNSHSVMPSQTSHQFSRIICGSRTIPPVGTCTLPRRLNSFYSYYYSALLLKMQPLLLIFNIILHRNRYHL